MATRREYSEQTASIIDREVRSLLDEAHERVHQTLTESRDALERIALLLLEREVVDRDELARAIGEMRVSRPERRDIVALTANTANTAATDAPVHG